MVDADPAMPKESLASALSRLLAVPLLRSIRPHGRDTMKYEEALAWLRGERSTVNWLDEPASSQADAAMTQQAYYVVRAHHEGLVDPADHTEGET